MRNTEFFKPFRTLYARITMWIMLTVLVVFVVITYMVTYFGAKGVLLGSTENAKSRMEITNQRINNVMQSVEVAVFNTIPEVEMSLRKPDDMYRIVRRLLEINPYIVGSAVAFEPYYYKEKGEQFSPYAYRGVGNNIYTKQLGTTDYEYHYMDWYLIPKLLKKNYWSEPYYDRGGGEQMMTTYSHPLYDKKGHIFAILTADISLEWVSDLLRKNDIEFNRKALELDVDNEQELQAEMENDSSFFYHFAYTYIIGKGGTYISHPLRDRILADTYFTYSYSSKDSIDNLIGYEMIDGKAGMRTVDRDGTKFVVSYSPIVRTGWSMATVIPYKLITNRSAKYATIIIGVMLFGLLVLFAVCRSILKRATRPLTHFARSADNIAKGDLNASLPQIRTRDEMKHLHDSFAMMQTSLKQQIEELKTVNEQKGRIEGELKVASDIQMSMLPKIYPPYPDRQDIDIFGSLTPAKAVGGDLFDFYIRDEKLFFAIGDVSGKGVPASLVMAVSRTLFRIVSSHLDEPSKIMEQMNEALSDQNDSNMFVTLFIGSLDLKTGHLDYCNGGHDAPLLINLKEKKQHLLSCKSNLPVGVMPGFKFEPQETDVDTDTLIFLYTDGLTEAENIDHQQFTETRIFNVAQELYGADAVTAHVVVERMTDAVSRFVGDAEQSDDLTMLAIKRKSI
ncbi:SpoIIE family protein phosphatase [Prevotella sp. MA2016]|uniref:SpoIIE family protein phosphatase n=1 Tax=Prevotella sp. MA2016 TaxID=1408310 RepID=UPI00056BA7E4|nr:SpoIIE family protein phosphatase [Prevotella sp. MA2016]